MKAARGKSGIIHTFTNVFVDRDSKEVVDEYPREINEIDVLRFYTKVLDVGARSAVISAPSCTNEAKELASQYKIRLEIKPNR